MWSAAEFTAGRALGLGFADFLILISLSHLSDGKVLGKDGWLPQDRETRKAVLRLLRHRENRRRR